MLGCGIRRAAPPLVSLVPPVSQTARIVVCSAVRDAENLGGIFRNCAAFGVDLVILGNGSVDPLARRVMRVSMATVLQLNFYESTNLESDLALLRDKYAMHFWATVLDQQAERLDQVDPPPRFGLVFGNEGAGIERTLAETCESRLTIPMSHNTDSLNVAVASGIFLYHFCQRRNDCG